MSNSIIKILLQAEVAKSSVESIKTQLDGIQRNIKPIKLNVDSKGTSGIKDMTLAFDKLEQVTKKNLSLDLDRLSNRFKNLVKPEDVSQIRSMIGALEHTDPKLGHNIDLIKVKMKEVSVGAEQSRRSLDLANKSAMSFGEAMKTAAYKFGIWSAVTASYFKVIREISTGIKFITEMDTALTEIGMVTNQTREQTAGLAKEYNSLAKEMKVLTSEVTSSAVEFYRQGLSQEETMERMRVSTMYSKIANLEFATSAEVLTATVNSMGIDIERAADVFLFLGDSTATSGAEIGKGFQKVGGTASALGIEFEKVASWIAIISSKTRESAESIGTSINAMLSRLSRITQTGFNEDDDTKLNDVAKALNTVGIALTDQTGNFRDFGTILDEIAVKWNTLDDQTQAYIANTIGGVRQQSRFFNLMNGYAESMTLYEQSLEAAGTAQSKFNLYLESNQATLDKFRTTLEGLWISVVDSDSLMSIVKAGTSFIELLDSMVQKFGTLNSALLVIIPLVGVRLAWAFRSAYVEVVKLIATGASKEVLATGGIFTKWAVSLTGVGTAAKGATVGMTGLTIATAGLTLGIGLLVAGVMWWANESKKAKEAFADALDNSQKLNDEVKSLDNLIKKQEELIAIENKSVEQKEELIKVQKELAQMYPQLATGIDEEGNKIAENLEMTRQLTEEKRKLLEQELLIIKMTAESKLPQLRQELADMQDEAQRIQDRLTSGDVYETSWVEGYEYQIDVTEDLKNKLLELVNVQREHYEEITNLEDGVRSYNQILEENAERHKWLTVETLALEVAMDDSQKNIERVERELKKLGFTSEDTANIISGNIDLVKEKYKELDMQQIINLQTIENLDATQKQAMMNMLENSRQATKQLVEDTKARITAIKAEMTALSALAGGKVKNISIVSKKGELDPKSGLLSNLSTIAQNEAIDAQRELAQLEGNLKQIDKALTNVSNISTKQISGTKDPKKGSSSSSSTKDQYKAEADRYARINLELDKNNILMQKNKVLQQNVGDDLAKKLKLMDEEIDLNNKRKSLLHDLNEEMRKEAKELQADLQGIFNFEGSWDDNSMVITNLEAIEGKGKDVEEKFKRVLDIIKTLPNASQEWVDIDFSNIALEIQKVITEFELLHKQFERLDKDLSNLEFGFKLIAEDNIEGQIENITKQVEIFENKLKTAQDELAKLGYVGESSPEHIKKQFEELTKIVQDSTLSIMEFEKKIDSIRESLRVEHIRKLTDAYNEQQESLRKLEQIQENLVAIIRKRGEEEKKALDKAHKAEMDSLEERHKSRKDKYKEELDEFKAMIQAKIDEMDRQNETEDYEENLDKEREKANEIQREIDVLALDTSLTAQNKVSDLRKKLAEQNEKIAKMQQERERKLLKQSLQDQLKDREKDANDRDNIADNLYDNEKKRLEEEYQIQKEFLEQKYSDASVYAEAKKAIIDGQVEYVNGAFMDIGTAFQEFEDNFGKGMGIMGDHIKNDLIANLEDAKRLLEETNMLSSMMSKPDSNQDFSDSEIGMPNIQRPNTPSYDDLQNNHSNRENQSLYNELIKNKKEWESLKNKSNKSQSDTNKMSQLKNRSNQIRSQWGINSDDYSYSDLEGMTVEDFLRRYGKYAQGGETQRTGLHMLDGRPGKPERVLSAEQTASFNKLVDIIGNSTFQDILKSITMPTAPKVPNVSPSQMSSFNIQKLIHIEGDVDEQTLPKLQKAGNDIAETLKNLNKSGVFRPIKI